MCKVVTEESLTGEASWVSNGEVAFPNCRSEGTKGEKLLEPKSCGLGWGKDTAKTPHTQQEGSQRTNNPMLLPCHLLSCWYFPLAEPNDTVWRSASRVLHNR